MTAANFTYAGGDNITVDWENPFGFGESIPDGTSAFTLCFTVIGMPGQGGNDNCSGINFTGDPLPINITTEEGGTFNIGLNENPGQVCILNQGDFTIYGSHETGDLGEEVCVDISVLNFNLINGLQFSIDWNDLGLVADYERVEVTPAIPGLTLSNFDVTSVGVNILSFSWSDPTGNGVTLPDSTVIFRVCYTVIGNANECTDIGFAENPLDIFVTNAFSNGDDIGLNSFDGSICANDYLRIQDSTIVDVNCPGTDDGEIFLRVIGGTGPYSFNWDNTTQQTEDISNLAPGTYTVTITDNSSPQRTVTSTFRVDVSNNAPLALAGPDRGMNCNTTPVILDGSGSSTGNNIRYQWTTLNTGGVISPSNRTLRPTITGPGTYLLEVINTNTQCSSFDTIVVTPPSYPDIPEIDDVATSCLIDSDLEIDASMAISPDNSFMWEALDGGTIRPGTESSSIAVVTGLGRYMLTVLNTRTGCSSKDTITVVDGAFIPTADAGPQMSLPCIADTITIGGVNTSMGSRFVYDWAELNGGNIIGSVAESSAEVNSTGLYVLTVSDTINGCVAIDSVEVIGDPNRPTADAGQDSILLCTRPSIQLNASNSSQGVRYIYMWTALSGGTIPAGQETTLQPTINTPGVYQLLVRDTMTGCDDLDLVVISQNLSKPSVSAGADINMGCRQDDVPLEGTANAFNTTLFYQWTTNGSGTIQDPDSLNTIVNGFGDYYLRVTDSINGCFAIDTITIIQDTTMRPVVTIAPVVQNITCKDTLVQLNAIGSSNGGTFIPSWTPRPAQGANSLTPKVDKAGIYRLTILDTSNGCLSSRTVQVDSNFMKPNVVIDKASLEIPCEPNFLELDALASNSGTSFTNQWTAANGSPITNPNGLRPQVSQPDTYTLTITSRVNGCKNSASVAVVANSNPINAIAGNDQEITCSNPMVNLDGSGSNIPGTATINWLNTDSVAVNSNTSWMTDMEGTYILSLRDTTDGCTSMDTIVVSLNNTPPTVTAGQDVEFNCSFENTSLSGNVTASGNNVSYLWSSINGGMISNPTSANPEVDGPGVYILTGTDETNGCIATDTVEIILRFNLPNADANGSAGTCEDFGMLDANLPSGVSGVWTTNSSAVIEFPNDNITEVTNLPGGSNRFIWTLSTDDCPNYSADTVTIVVEGKPDARNDFETLPENQNTIDINILANDDLFGGINNFTYSLISNPDPGFIINNNGGIITYERSKGFEGTDDFFYTICNNNCPNFCDTAFVSILVEKRPVSLDSLPPNAITPNEDGLNDALIFDILDEFPEEFERNEITIFNRWGDVVYQAKPYLNDWKGTNQNGKPLPQATYYYILRLNVSEGQILRGNVTILK
ncbi:MAG: gliding motility-associated C-terminal domain-containing protein [Saprospiraceae bacterium]